MLKLSYRSEIWLRLDTAAAQVKIQNNWKKCKPEYRDIRDFARSLAPFTNMV